MTREWQSLSVVLAQCSHCVKQDMCITCPHHCMRHEVRSACAGPHAWSCIVPAPKHGLAFRNDPLSMPAQRNGRNLSSQCCLGCTSFFCVDYVATVGEVVVHDRTVNEELMSKWSGWSICLI